MDVKYKIIQGYEHERDISINADELERAYGLFMLGGRWIFSGGAVDGKNIQTIVEDWHSTMGWNQEHKLGPDDFEELRQKGLDSIAKKQLAEAKHRVNYFISSKQPEMIGKDVAIPALENSAPQVQESLSALARKMTEPTFDR